MKSISRAQHGFSPSFASVLSSLLAVTLFYVCFPLRVSAQTPIALPNTITTIAGGSTSSPGVGTACSAGSPYIAADSLGDGCPATQVALGADLRGGVGTDNFGNVFLLDYSNSALRMIDSRSGLITLIAGKGTVCSTKTDGAGDGCLAATQTVLNSPRGMGVDPYGNVFIAGYSQPFIELVCRAVSPLCSASQIGFMIRVAGYTSSTSSGGTSVAGVTAGSAGDGAAAFSTTATNGLDQPRGVAADRYGNVYIGDTGNSRYRVVVGPASFNGVANPLASLIALNPAYSSATATTAAGVIYPLAGGFASTPVAGAFCNGTSGAKALDTFGNGCPYFYSTVGGGVGGAVQGVAVDSTGDIILADAGNSHVRVIYMGGMQMANLIVANNQSNGAWVDTPTSLNIGSIYLLAGRGSTNVSATPTLGSKTALSGNLFKITLDALGDIYVGDNSRVDFIDVNTGYVRALITSGTNCTAATDSIGDGCPASQSNFSGSNGLGVAVDNLGNLYLADAGNIRVRKVSAASLISTTVGSTTNQNIEIHIPAVAQATAATGLTASFAASSPEIVAGSVSCAAANADFSLDCSVSIAFTPAAPGTRSATLAVASTSESGGGTPVDLIVSGSGQGAALAVDSSATSSLTLGSGLKPQSVALDGAGNVYTVDANTARFTEINTGGTVLQLPGTVPTNASQIAVDTQGNLYAVGTGTTAIAKLTLAGPGSWTVGSVSYTPPVSPAQPQAIAVDSNGTIYVYDQTNTAIYKISQSSALQPLTRLAGGFANVVAMALDPNGNLYVADQGAQHVYKVTQTGVQTTVPTPSAITPVGVATDAAGNLFIQDAVSNSVIQVSVSGPGSSSNQTTVLSGLTSPNGIAVDGNGNLYSSDAVNPGIVKVLRSQVSYDFGTSISTSLAATLSSAGNTVATGYAQSDASDFQLSAGATNGCTLTSPSIPVGYACTISASFAPSGSGTGPVTDALSLIPPASSVGALTLGGTKNGTTVTTTTVISGQTPAGPVYSASGTEASFTITVTPSSGSVSGTNVQVTVDGGSPTSYVLSGSSITVALSGLTAGTHTISATYLTQSGIIGSSSTVTSFSITPLGTSVTWTPASTTQQVSQPIGTSVLNASSNGVSGLFSYMATPSGGSPMLVDASTYLPIGTYALSVTFTPTDGVDYSTSIGSVASLTVTKANTTAAVGATQNLVATDGSGNFTTVQAAINALSPTAGGTVYIAPGTYSGFVTVNTPFVSLRGLGGNPANVLLTNENGAFSAPFLPGQGVGNGGSSGDQGSSTMVVAKGTVNGTTYTPNAFYMENLTVANTYDTDTTNSNTNAVVGGACTAGQPGTNNQALFNAGTLCNSQALALWITADQAVLNDVQLTSLQDTLYSGSQGCGAPCVAARQYFWKGRINGDVDYIFGDAATVFDHTVFYTTYHGSTATGTETIEAQNKKAQTGSSSDYLSGYVLNQAYLLSQSSGMTNLDYGRPYGQYSTYIMLNSFVDQVNPVGWIEFSGDTNLPTSTYAEFNTSSYTDPATGSADPNGFVYTGTGGSAGAGVTGTRETVSTDPGTLEATNAIHTTLTAAQAVQYYPIAFLSSPVPTPSPTFAGFTNTWDPTAALTTGINQFVPAGSSITVNSGSSVTILVRPQTPGGGVIPTGTYTVLDGATTIASGTLDASGEAYFTTRALAGGVHNITTTYSGDANFNGSSSANPFVITVNAIPATTTTLGANATQVQFGASVMLTATVSASSGTPTGTVVFAAGATNLGSVALPGNGVATLTTTALSVGTDSVVATYSGDANFGGSSGSTTVAVTGSLNFNTTSLTFTSQTDGTSSSPTGVTLTNNTGSSIASIAITAPTGFTISNNTCVATFAAGQSCGFSVAFSPVVGQTGTISGNVTASGSGFSASLPVSGAAAAMPSAPAVATGDTRTVMEPSFPATCQSLTASFHDVNEDVPASVETTSTELDQARLQAALNSCTGTNQAVELSMDASGNNAFLTGPITIPTGVTLLVDPGVTLYFSRNAQDYDTVQGTHTCGTVNAASNTASCQNLISITNANNSGIMGFGKLNGRGGDVVLNSFPSAGFEGSTTGKSWWDLANDADALGGSQQNPRGIQVSKSTNITFYKITFKNAPNFHVALSSVNDFTVWDMKIITPYTSRNTDGIDPSGTTNATITNSWISDGDDNIAVGGSGAASANISVVNNHFFAGHGESIGSITTNGVSNVLFDNNAMYGDSDVDGSNSTAIRIKSANDRGGLVQDIQYSNSCFANHGTQIQFTPVYNTNSGTLTPNFKNILLQNLRFSNQGPVSTGLVQFLGASNNGTINPLVVTLDNVTMDALASTNLTAPTNAQITFGPGQVSSTLTSLLLPFNGTNGNVITDNRTTTSLVPPACNFTFLVPELTSSTGTSQTLTAGQFPTAVVILSPAFSSISYPYPTGTVTVTDEANRSFTATLSGSGDTTFIPITNAPAGTHTYTASYSGDTKYPAITSFGTLMVTVNAGSLPATTIALSGIPAATTFGTGFTATAVVAGSNPTGSVAFLVNGAVYASAPISGGAATYAFNLPFGSYTINAVYSGDGGNAGSSSASFPVTVTGALTTTSLVTSATTTIVGTPVALTATAASSVGTPIGTVSFSYTTSTNSTPTVVGNATLINGAASFSALLPEGTDNVTASYVANGNFGASTSGAVTITVNPAPVVPISAAPVAVPYTISTLVGGGSSTANTTCTGHLDSFGDGCLGTAIQITGGTSGDLRGITVDPFGNVYFTDANAAMVRKIATNGVVTSFAGYISGTACVTTATVGCTPTLVKLTGKPRGVYSDALGNIYIAGYGDDKVQVVKVTDGKMYLVAGTGSAPTNTTDNAGDGGPAVSALLKQPRSVATDAAGNIYIADTGDNRIREVLNPASGLPGAGNIQTVAGTGTTSSTGDGGLATLATLNNPQGVLVDSNANIYIAESSKVRAVCVTCAPGGGLYNLLTKLGIASPVNGNIYTIAGTSTSSNSSLQGGLGNAVNMAPQKLAMDADGNLYIDDSSNNVVWFEDSRTGYTRVIAGGGTATSCAASAIGDGCPATQAIFGSNGGNGIGVALDQQNNMYISDSTNLRIRKVSNNLRFNASAVAAPVTQTVQLHFVAGDSPTSTVLTSPDFSLSAGSCTVNPSDQTDDCTYTATFTPAVAGQRSAPLAVTTTLNNSGYFGFTGTGQGAGATLDPASQLTFGQNLVVNAVTTDNAGNVYVADGASKAVLKYSPGTTGIGAGTSAVFTTLGTFTNPSALTVDSLGNVYVADASTGLVTQISSSGVSKALGTGFLWPQGLAVDSLNNLYVSDSSAKSVTEVGANLTGSRVIANSNLVGPAGLAVDNNSNIFVTDPSAGAVYRYDAQTLVRTTATSAASAPKSVAVDAAGNLLVADSGSGNILAVPASANSAVFTVVSGLPANALALDSAGDVYTMSSSNQVLELERTQGLTSFSRGNLTPVTVNLLSTGNSGATLTLTDPDQTNFALTLSASTDCVQSGTINVIPGGTCQFISQFTPSSASIFSNTAVFSGNAANPSLASPPILEIVQNGNDAPFPVTVTLGAFVPALPVYGQPVTLSATVASTDGTPAGTVTFSVDGTSLAPAAIGGGSASIADSGLTAGVHTVTATFTSSDGSFATTTSAAGSLTIAKATPTISWATPSSIIAGTPLSAVQLNATSTTPGSLSYAPPIGTILSAGVHTLSTTFTPTDSTDYNTATATVTFTVIPATVIFTVSSTQQTYPTWANFVVTPVHTGNPVPTGTVTIFDGTISLVTLTLGGDGKAYWTTNPPLSAGTHQITVSYSGDKNYPAGGSAVTTITVAPAPVNMGVSCWGGSPYGVNYTCQANLSSSAGSATGSITYTFDGGSSVSVPISNGSAQFVIAKPAAGSHHVVVSYAGQGNYASVASQTFSFTTQPGQTQLLLSPSSYYIKSGSSLTLTASASTPQSGVPIGTVTFYDNGASIGSSAVGSNGVAVFVIPAIAQGKHNFTAAFTGAMNYANASSGSSGVTAY